MPLTSEGPRTDKTACSIAGQLLVTCHEVIPKIGKEADQGRGDEEKAVRCELVTKDAVRSTSRG